MVIIIVTISNLLAEHCLKKDQKVSVSLSTPNSTKPPLNRKKRWSNTLLNVALLLSVAVCVAVYALPIFSHELYPSAATYNFGKVKAGFQISHTFTLRNLHPWAVTITGLTSSCGCTKSFVGQKVPFSLQPLQHVSVEASVDTKFKRGHVTENVSLSTSDNSQPISLLLRGEVE